MSQGWRPVPAARLVRLTFFTLLPWLCPATSDAAPPTWPDGRLGIRTAPLLLLSRQDVRADVGLDAAQGAEAERALEELYTQAVALKGKSGPEALARKRSI